MNVCLCMQCMWRLEEGVMFPDTGVTSGCDLPCGYWEPSMVFLQEQKMPITTEQSPVPVVSSLLLLLIDHVYFCFLLSLHELKYFIASKIST